MFSENNIQSSPAPNSRGEAESYAEEAFKKAHKHLGLVGYAKFRNAPHDVLWGKRMKTSLLFALMFCLCSAAFAGSVITTRPDDSKAIYVDAPAAKADSSAALQAAMDKAGGSGREGIVFVPEGRYALTRTIYVWPGVRLIGYGATRPIFVLPPQTPGFQSGMGVMVMFTGLTPS